MSTKRLDPVVKYNLVLFTHRTFSRPDSIKIQVPLLVFLIQTGTEYFPFSSLEEEIKKGNKVLVQVEKKLIKRIHRYTVADYHMKREKAIRVPSVTYGCVMAIVSSRVCI